MKYKDKIKKRRTVLNAIIRVHANNNNTIISATDVKGNTLAWTSAGERGFKNTKKSTPFAAQITSEACIKKLTQFGIKNIEIEIYGMSEGRDAALRNMQTSGYTIVSIRDITPIQHNGCRPPKTRRV